MLRKTFCHIPRIGEKTERRLWSAGVTSWDAGRPDSDAKLPKAVLESWPRYMQESIDNHANRNPRYFAERLSSKQHWRLYSEFQDVCAFLDIETTGLYGYDVPITTIA